MPHVRILDEGLLVQDYCTDLDFVGDGVTATRPSNNDRVTVTIPGAAAVSGWTDDGAVVRLTTAADQVGIGTATMVGTEKVRILNAAGVGLRLEGREDHPFVSTAATSAATQRSSYIERFTASAWTGAAAVERDWDVYNSALTSQDESGGFPVSQLAFDYEGVRLLTVSPATPTAAPGTAAGIIFYNGVSAGGVVAFDFRAINDLGAGDPVFVVRDNSPITGVSAVTLFTVRGNGDILNLGDIVHTPDSTYNILSAKSAGAGVVAGIDLEVTVDFGVADAVVSVKDSAATLFTVFGTGNANALLSYSVAGTKVVGAQGAAVADPAGGAVIDVEARAQLALLLARVRAATGHGLIA